MVRSASIAILHGRGEQQQRHVGILPGGAVHLTGNDLEVIRQQAGQRKAHQYSGFVLEVVFVEQRCVSRLLIERAIL